MQRLLRIHLRGSSSSRIQRGRSPLTFSTLSASSSNLVPTHFLHRRGFTCQNRAYLCFSFRPLPRKLLVFSAAAVLPLLTERRDDEEDDTKELTLEQSLLETSEEERRERKHGNKDWPMLYRFFNRLKVAFLQYVYETIATSLRFIQLVVIFVPVLATVPVIFVGSRDPRHDNERSGTLWWYWFLVGQMERAGPTFIKLGQWAASRTDIFPAEMCQYMSKLHSNVNAHKLSETKRIIEEAFDGRAFDTIWDEFDEMPLGIGAIAQVYRAKVNPDLIPPSLWAGTSGQSNKTKILRIREQIAPLIKQSPDHVPSTHVAIKVLHPGVRRTIYRDLRIMRFFATLMNAIPTIEWLSLPDEVDKFSEMMKLQLDLRIECTNLEIFQRNFEQRSTVTFPAPYQEYTTRKVLIEEFAHGLPLPWFLEHGGGPYSNELADMGLDAFLRMLLIDNFVHADLHPGNIMVRFYKSKTVDLHELIRILWSRPSNQSGNNERRKPVDDEVTEEAIARLRPHKNHPVDWNAELDKLDKEGFRPQLIFIDTGLVTELNDVNRRNFLDLFRAVAEFDGYRAGHLMIERCRQPEAVIDPEIFALKMQHLVLGVKSKTFALGQIKFGDVLHEVLTMVRNHHVRLEGDFVNVVISILLLEGIGRQLDPNMDLFKSAIPILREVGVHRARQAIAKGESPDLKTSGAWLKLWVGLETRNLISASVQEVERLVKYDGISPNV